MLKVNYTIEQLYLKIQPEVNLISSYLEDTRYKELIIRCRLKPYKYNSMFDRILKLRKHWVDEFGNSVHISKRSKVVENDLSIDVKNIKFTDLYDGLSIDKVAKISNKIHIISGKDEDFNKDYLVLTFLGIDRYYRTYILYQDEWMKASPIGLGINRILNLIDNDDVVFHVKLKNKEECFFPCKFKEEWLVSLPVTERFWKESGLDKSNFKFLGDNY